MTMVVKSELKFRYSMKANLPFFLTLALSKVKKLGDFKKNLWPSQNILTLNSNKIFEIILESNSVDLVILISDH